MQTKALLIVLFDILCSKAAAKCINYTSFSAQQLESDVRAQLIDGSATHQAEVLYKFLSEKYCWLHWLVLIRQNVLNVGEWGQSDWSSHYYHTHRATSAFGALFLDQRNVSDSFVNVVWSNSIAPWNQWSFFREDFIDALFNPSDKNIRRLCNGDDNWWSCRVQRTWFWGWHGYVVPFQCVVTLRHNHDIALRYTDGFAFVHCGRTYAREANDASLAPPGVDLSDFEAILMSTMTNCPFEGGRGDESCMLPSWNRENIVDKQVRSFDCTGFECDGTARKVNTSGEAVTVASRTSAITSNSTPMHSSAAKRQVRSIQDVVMYFIFLL